MSLKNEVHAILHAHLIPRCPHADLFNKRGRDGLTRRQRCHVVASTRVTAVLMPHGRPK